jgi:hypothetical protein
MKRTIVNPHWINNARTVITADFQYEDGRVLTATISETETTNPDLIEIKQKFTEQQLEENTQRKIRNLADQRAKDKEQKEAQALRKQQEELFAAKLKIFEIDSIKTSQNRPMKSRIRKSKSDVEAMAWAAVLMLEEANKEVAEQQESTPGE